MRDRVSWGEFSDYLRAIRHAQGMTQEDLARKLGCSANHIWRLEHGSRHPSKSVLLLLAVSFRPTSEDELRIEAWLEPVKDSGSTE